MKPGGVEGLPRVWPLPSCGRGHHNPFLVLQIGEGLKLTLEHFPSLQGKLSSKARQQHPYLPRHGTEGAPRRGKVPRPLVRTLSHTWVPGHSRFGTTAGWVRQSGDSQLCP